MLGHSSCVSENKIHPPFFSQEDFNDSAVQFLLVFLFHHYILFSGQGG